MIFWHCVATAEYSLLLTANAAEFCDVKMRLWWIVAAEDGGIFSGLLLGVKRCETMPIGVAQKLRTKRLVDVKRRLYAGGRKTADERGDDPNCQQ